MGLSLSILLSFMGCFSGNRIVRPPLRWTQTDGKWVCIIIILRKPDKRQSGKISILQEKIE